MHHIKCILANMQAQLAVLVPQGVGTNRLPQIDEHMEEHDVATQAEVVQFLVQRSTQMSQIEERMRVQQNAVNERLRQIEERLVAMQAQVAQAMQQDSKAVPQIEECIDMEQNEVDGGHMASCMTGSFERSLPVCVAVG